MLYCFLYLSGKYIDKLIQNLLCVDEDLTNEALSSTICNHTSSSSLLDSSIGRLLGSCSPTEFDVMQLLQADCIPGLDVRVAMAVVRIESC
jgi:hypothetical protein